MLSVIVSVEDKPLYVKVEGHNIILTTNILEASKFEESGFASSFVLNHTRKVFPDKKFCIGVSSSSIFGSKPRNLISEEVIVNDSFYHTDIY